MSTVRLVDAVSLAKRIENLDITIAGDEAKWNDAKSTVLREIADSPTHDLFALIKAAQAEAVKEFVYRVEECVKPSKSYPFESLVGMSDIYSIKKEMLGED